MGGTAIFERGRFALSGSTEQELSRYLSDAQLYRSQPVVEQGGAGGSAVQYTPPVSFPPHDRSVAIEVDLGLGSGCGLVLGADLTHEYVAENADYRS